MIDTTSHFVRSHVWASVLSTIVMVMGVLVLVGWHINSVALKSIFPGIVSMNPTTAVSFILAGVSIHLYLSEKRHFSPYILLVGILLFLHGAIRLVGVFGGPDLHIDQMLFHEKIMQVTAFANNRLAPNTALNFMLLGSSLVLLSRRRFFKVVHVLMFTTFMIALFAIIGYLYSVKDLYGLLSYTPMALNTALAFFIMSICTLLMKPYEGMMRVMSMKTEGGAITRQMIGAVVFVPMLFGFLTIRTIDTGVFNTEYALSVLIALLIFLFLLITYFFARSITAVDAKRQDVEDDLKRSNEKIQKSSMLLDEKLKESEHQNTQLEQTKRAMLNVMEDIKEEKARDEAILTSIGDGLVVCDEDGHILLVNDAFEKILGLLAADVIGKNLIEVVGMTNEEGIPVSENKRPTYRALRGTLVTVTPTGTPPFYVRKDGSRFPVAITVTPIYTGGKVTGAVEVFRDISEERKIDKAKSEFVSLASHQLRTPLTAISWYLELLGESKLTKAQQSLVAQVLESSGRMAELVTALLNVSRIDLGTLASSPVDTDVVALSESVFAELAPAVQERKITLEKKYPNEGLMFFADPQLMRIIFQNLLSNAVKYTPEGGTVSIVLSKDEIVFHLSVSDTGYGIPPSQSGKIFEKFFRADNVREKEVDGNGLGLYMVKSVVETHSGKIWFESVVNKGTTFYIELPASGMKKIEGSKTLA